LHRVKRILSISFLVLYLLTTTEFYQLFKLNSFVEHFQEHKAKNGTISVLEFLNIHYGHANVNDEDHDQDMKLPFKSCSNDFSSIQMITHTIEHFVPLSCFAYYTSKTYVSTESFLIPSYLSAIWQPPRVV
jgi:hypothetical protein